MRKVKLLCSSNLKDMIIMLYQWLCTILLSLEAWKSPWLMRHKLTVWCKIFYIKLVLNIMIATVWDLLPNMVTLEVHTLLVEKVFVVLVLREGRSTGDDVRGTCCLQPQVRVVAHPCCGHCHNIATWLRFIYSLNVVTNTIFTVKLQWKGFPVSYRYLTSTSILFLIRQLGILYRTRLRSCLDSRVCNYFKLYCYSPYHFDRSTTK